ncbi:putative anti-sigma regulatory factor, serine/threonine protein kinase [Flexistipes sinusarabici DSM 4947]|uniref:Anti-sigma regulatory factor, serine/threonine protein kinase n=1 Tax=Flexistipes sinusarabici (strain ATCC 49648 / DSM 4947 / MAS 10) TaxID=717231 RepID=F8E9N8_FLESM|nr:ATP-binding protein [Flexistipes sinusarabici]AEI14221.1 putative anti-sigma regulatory factor, serine/threonine protein kinase [Flexistipes sinusarabici DSM 4947]
MHTKPSVMELTVPGNIKLVSALGETAELFVKSIVRNGGEIQDLAFKINLALTEAASNAIFYGCKNSEHIRIKIELDNNTINIEVIDKGGGLELSDIQKPDPFDERGRGLYIIKQFMDSIDYHQNPDGECVFTMKKYITTNSQII